MPLEFETTNLPVPTPFTPPSVQLLNLEVLDYYETLRQSLIVMFRKYFEGSQDTKVTDRLKEFMPSLTKVDFRLNIVSVIINAMTEKLYIRSLDSDDLALLEWANRVWKLNKLDSRQNEAFENALVETESFFIISWDNDAEYPVWTPMPTYTNETVGGTGYGCRIFYEQNDPNQKPLYAVKLWSEVDSEGEITNYKTVYFPDRIEKYARTTGDWNSIGTDPWVDDLGDPIGIPVIHLLNKNGRSEVEDALPMQDATNKTVLDTLMTSDQTAFRIYVALGWIPTTDGEPPKEDGSNLLTVEPGTIISTDKSKSDVSFDTIEPPQETIEGQANLAQQLIVWTALATSTPVTRVITTKLIASDETLKQQDEPLENKVSLRRSIFGDAILQGYEISKKLEEVFGNSALLGNMDSVLSLIWGSRAKMSNDELDTLAKKRALGIPEQQIWIEMGYDSKKRAQMLTWKNDERNVNDGNTEQGPR